MAALVAAGVTALLVNIIERKEEAQNPFYLVVELTDETEDPAIWGKNFPMQYDAYRRTVDPLRTRFGGSEAVPRTPTAADPHSLVVRSRLEEDPRLMWAGYPFATDTREARGHAYMLEDTTFTERQIAARQPGICLHCHASTYVPYRRLGAGDLFAGFPQMNKLPFSEARQLVTHPIACIDCHAPDTMQLRVTRPAFIEGMRQLKAAQGVEDYDFDDGDTPGNALVALIRDLQSAHAAGKTDVELDTAQNFQRKAQFFLDFVEAENSMGFHAPQEAARILAESIDFSRQGQIALRGVQ